MNALPRAARIYVVAMVVAGAGLLATFGQLPGRADFPVFLGLITATLLTSTFKLKLPTTKGRATMSVSFVIDFASILIIGPQKTMLLTAVGAITQSTLKVAHKNPLHRILFNVACLVVTVQAAGAVYQLTGGTVGRLVWPQDVTALSFSAIAYFTVNSGAIALAVSLSTHQPLKRVWHHNFLWGAPSYFIGAAIAAVIGEMVFAGIWGLLPVVAVAVYLTYRAYSVFAGRLTDEHRHREVIESLNEGMAVVHRDGRIALWNDALERIVGVSRECALGRQLVEAVPELAATAMPQVIGKVLETGNTDTLEHFAIHRADGRRILQVRIFPFMQGVTVFWHDITERSEAEDALKQSEERYALAAAGSNDGLWDWDLARGEIYLSRRWKDMLGLTPQADFNRPEQWFERIHSDDLAPFEAALDAHVRGETTHFEHEHRIRHEDGTYRSVLCRGMAVRKADGHATRIAGSQTDVTERTAIQEQLRHAALHDSLTGLPNRALFLELLGQVLDRSRRHPEHNFAVLFLDCDRFKVVNDSLGHVIGDQLLVALAQRLNGCLREGDVIARQGGDEFTILLNDLGEAGQVSLIAERIHEALREPFVLRGHEVFTTASIGIALSMTGYTNAQDILRDADTAMYRAKALGKARHELFDASMHARAVDRLRLENDLRRAVDRGEFSLHYQPIVAVDSGKMTGFEALLRWQRGGIYVSPAEFIPVAEETGLIRPLGAWVLQEACRQIAVWRAQFPNGPALGVTVNVSARQITGLDFLDTVADAVRQSNLKPGDLRLEITETALMENPELAEFLLRQLRALGVKVYLDDFGTGFSSLSHLHRFPVDTLKIDRSFVANLTGAKHQPAFVEGIVALARAIGTQVIAEGVETEGQLNEVRRMGCTEAQGFLFAGPLTASAAEALLARREGKAPLSVATAVPPAA